MAAFVGIDSNPRDFANTDRVRPGSGEQSLPRVRGERQTEALTAEALLVLDGG